MSYGARKTPDRMLLAAAVRAPKMKEIKTFSDEGADIHTQNEWGLTPIMLAAQYNPSVNVLKALLEQGLTSEAEPKYDPTPCICRKQERKPENH